MEAYCRERKTEREREREKRDNNNNNKKKKKKKKKKKTKKKERIEKLCVFTEVADYRHAEGKLKSSRSELSMYVVVSPSRPVLFHPLHPPLMGSS